MARFRPWQLSWPRPPAGSFRVAQEDQGLGAVHRLGATFTGLQRQQQRTGQHQRRKEHVGPALQALGETQQILHLIVGTSAQSVKADKPFHGELPASRGFPVIERVFYL